MKRFFKDFTYLLAFFIYFFTAPLARSQDLKAVLRPYQQALAGQITGKHALEIVKYLQQFWRYSGNPDFNTCMAYIESQLQDAGFSSQNERFQLAVQERFFSQDSAWQPAAAALQIISPLDTLLQSLEQAKMSLCVNSYSTPAGGIEAEIVAVDGMTDIKAGELAGKIAYTHRHPRAVFEKAIATGGALGIISSYLPAFNRAATHPDLVSMSAIPHAVPFRAFGFKISYGNQQLLDSLLQKGAVRVKATVKTRFLPKRVREVSAWIKGVRKPAEVITLIAHLDEPGANDNASGSATLVEIATGLKKLIASQQLAPPDRTLKFMWVEEFRTIRRWQKQSPEDFKRVKAALVLDMVGENTAITGGTFLIEKMPDPSAIWTRPPDQHTEWGKRSLSQESLHGSYLNDLFYAACQVVAEQTDWQFKTNPFEGGSDHVPFIRTGIPAILAWHFTDVFYHTSGDQIDKVSPQEMARVGIAVGSTAYFLAKSNLRQTQALLNYLAKRGEWRLNNELKNSQAALKALSVQDTLAISKQKQILAAWRKWYDEAYQSIENLPILVDEKQQFDARILRSQNELAVLYHNIIKRLENATKTIQDSHH